MANIIWESGWSRECTFTEEEIRKLHFDAFENDDISVSEQKKAEQYFKDIVDSYLAIYCDSFIPDTTNENADFDFYGDTIDVEWKESDRCGDYDYFKRSFPLAHLWAPDWEAEITAAVEKKRAAEHARIAAKLAEEKANREIMERKQLAKLLEKYGLPPEYQGKEKS